MKIILSIYLTTCCGLNIYAQDSSILKQRAITIENQDSLGQTVYDAISKYQLFMIGESHGSNESAKFVENLTNLLIRNGSHVQIGLEIPSSQMNNLRLSPSDRSILNTTFFKYNRRDGRGSFAWVNLIENFINRQNVEVFYFDIDTVNDESMENRDSLMYINIKKRILTHPTWITIILCGNIHNILLPYDEKKKAGLFLYSDKDLNVKNKMLSLKHVYSTGDVWGRHGDTLQLSQVDNSNSVFSKTINSENYLFIYPEGVKMNYSGIYFTRKITASKLVNNN